MNKEEIRKRLSESHIGLKYPNRKSPNSVWNKGKFKASNRIKTLLMKYYPLYINHSRSSRRQIERRLELFDILGGWCCVRCGFSDIRALQFDHINGGGTQQRKQLAVPFQTYYISNPELARKELQVLCANCNWIKRHDNKEFR